jgi:predicted nucleotidyltransferase component of viral defense system
MTKPEQLAASVRQRLKNLTGTTDFQTMLVRYALERLLYRLSQSNYRQQFVLKGALLFDIWLERSHRATRDVDFLGFGDNTPARIEEIFRELCSIDVIADGLEFAVGSVVSSRIKADCEYEGVRINLLAYLAGTRTQIPVQVDVGFGDAITPSPISVEFPALLSFPAPQVLSYPPETVVAEKFQAMVLLGMSNTRLKDFYDLWVLATYSSFDSMVLGAALTATFERRRTRLPQTRSEVVALTPLFTTDSQKQQAWKAFLRKHQLVANELSLMEVVEIIQGFVLPISATASRRELFIGQWDCDRREWKV